MGTQLNHFASAAVAVAVVEPDTTALVIAQVMRQYHVGALVVIDAQDKSRPVGIVTMEDVLELLTREFASQQTRWRA